MMTETKQTAEILSLERKIKMHEARERIFNRINPEAKTAINLDRFLQATVNELGKMMEVDRCDVMILASEGGLRINYEYRADESIPSSIGLQIPFDLPQLRSIVDLKRPIAIDDTTASTLNPIVRLLAQTIKTRSLLVVPIALKTQVVGMFGFHHCHKQRHWTEEEIAFLQEVAQQIAVGYEYTKIYTEKEKEAEITKALLGIATDINTQTDFAKMASTVVDRSIDLLRADLGCLGLLDSTGKYLHFDTFRTAYGLGWNEVAINPLLITGNEIVREFFDKKRALKLDSPEQNQIAYYYLNKVFNGQSALVVPIIIKDKVLGCLAFVWLNARQPLTDYEVELAEGIANQLSIAVERDKLTAEVLRLRRELGDARAGEKLIGRSEKFVRCIEMALYVADNYTTVLLQGESGTGKELIADLIRFNSSRHDKPYVKINCGAIPESLLETELFGHEKGAFTDARARRIGKFEEASGGTLFLDEIGEMSLGAQVKLLRVLQDGEFTRVGGNEVIKADVRVIAATNSNLSEAIEKGRFRRDLYYRLNIYPITLPPLRERQDDIPLLALHFLEMYRKKSGKYISISRPRLCSCSRAIPGRGTSESWKMQ